MIITAMIMIRQYAETNEISSSLLRFQNEDRAEIIGLPSSLREITGRSRSRTVAVPFGRYCRMKSHSFDCNRSRLSSIKRSMYPVRIGARVSSTVARKGRECDVDSCK